jgi:hypothetical protein
VNPALDFKILTQSTASAAIAGWFGDDDFTGQFSSGIVTINDAVDEDEGLLANSTKPQSKRLQGSRMVMMSDHATTARPLSKYPITSLGMNMRAQTPSANGNIMTADWFPFLLEKTSMTAKSGVFRLAKPLPAPDPLASYEQYASANWDAEGAEPITPAALTYARHIMRLLPNSFGQPDVAPATDGSIGLQWVPEEHHKLDRLFIDIGPGEVWRAYWMLRHGTYGRLTGEGYSGVTLQKLFSELNR